MSSESSKKRKPKVIRSEGAPAEGKRTRSDTEQVRSGGAAVLLRNLQLGAKHLAVGLQQLRVMGTTSQVPSA